ncbi:MAG TPA: T9SS type A sorting domain-containing protein [Ignavibacteriaceae bacterium]|nr:T9SS type A sorting domain-containing protein [Ignavibacteriaceae bacterium]
MKKLLLIFVLFFASLNFAQSLGWWNLQWPPNGYITSGEGYTVYGQVWGSGITEPPGQAPGLQAWVGYSTSNTNPNTWLNWIPATFNTNSGNNDEYQANLGANISAKGTYYYAFRYQYNSEAYVYGGTNGPWNGTNNLSGILTVFAASINSPTSLTASSTLPKKVILNWYDNSINETNYIVMRKAGGDTTTTTGFTNIASLPQNATTYTDSLVSDLTQYSYYVYASNADTLSPRSNYVTIFTVVPVELTSFTYSVKEKGIELNWITASEKNNKGFDVERNTNGNWENIAFVEGNGTSTEINKYKFVDNSFNKSAQNIKYRLRQTDFDGTSEYIGTVNVFRDITPSRYLLEQNYPNPFNPSTLIKYALPFESKVTITVYNSIGQIVTQLVNRVQSEGNHQVTFNAQELSSGLYFYEIKANSVDGKNSFSKIMKMMLMK